MENFTGYENSTNTTDIITLSTLTASIGIISGFNVFLAITATLGNVLILIALHKVSSIYPPTKLLFRCLAVTDLCAGLISQPLYVIYLISIIPNMNIHHLHTILKAAVMFFWPLLTQMSVLTSAAISADRLLALSLGLRYKHAVNLRRVRVVVVCFSLISSLTAAVSTSSVIYISYLIIYVLILFSLVISMFSYTKIFLNLRHQQAQIQEHVQPGQPNGGSSLNIARYKKTVSSISWIQLTLFVCYAPYLVTVIVIWYRKIRHSTAIEVALQSFVTLVYLNSSLNPILYCWRIRDVRQEVKNMIRQVWC